MRDQHFQLFATAPKGLELLLVDELKELGASDAAEKLAGVTFTGNLETAYRACLWSRLANRILLQLGKEPVETPEMLYKAIQTIQWDKHLGLDSTFLVHFVSSQSKITHTLFGAQKVKDAIADQFTAKYRSRPNVDKMLPDVSVYVYLYRDVATIYLDLSGDSLHKRGYRLGGGAAPLKENLAAAILMRAKWPQLSKDQASLYDPMCGSGTLLIEAALISADIAPGLLRNHFGFKGWKLHQPKVWDALLRDAENRREAGLKNIPTLIGFDQNPEAIHIAFDNIDRAGLRGKIHVEKRELSEFSPKAGVQPGLVVTNPPYGERLGEIDELGSLYTLLGDRLKAEFSGWHAAVFTGNPELGKVMGLRAKKYYSLFNGAIPCQLLLFDVSPEKFIDRSPQADNARLVRSAKKDIGEPNSRALQDFINRLRKNIKHHAKQARRAGLSTYRVYDADLPDYAFAIDVRDDSVLLQEYPAPKEIDKQKVLQRRQEVLAVLPEELQVNPEQIYFSVLPREK